MKTNEQFLEELKIKNKHYDDIEVIGKYAGINNSIKCKYKTNGYIWFPKACNLLRGHLNMGKELILYKYNINDIIEISSGKIEILEQNTNDKLDKIYKYKCLECGYIGCKKENDIINKIGCRLCDGKYLCVGYNDINTTNSKLTEWMLDKNDSYLYTQWSSKRIDWICPYCGNIIYDKRIDAINKNGLSCDLCGHKGNSFPERFINNILYKLDLKIKTQKTFEWNKRKRYDIYIKNYNMIIEIMGNQHYEESTMTKKNLKEEQENDQLKYDLAMQNGIDKYIVIDARQSDFEYIKKSIINSELNNLFDLSGIDWDKCYENAQKNIIKEAWDLWNNNKSVKEISVILDKARSTIVGYLKIGTKIGKCNYDAFEQKSLNGKNNGLKVVCLNTKEIFESMSFAERELGIKKISECCNKKRKSAGKNINTGEELIWELYDKIKHKDFISYKKKR